MRLVPIALALIHAKDCLESYCNDEKKEKTMKEIDDALEMMIESEMTPSPFPPRSPVGPYSWAYANKEPGSVNPVPIGMTPADVDNPRL